MLSAIGAMLFTLATTQLTHDILWLGLAFGAAYFCVYTMYSFTFTIAKELVPDATLAMATREVLLTGGRVIGSLMVLVSVVVYENLVAPLVFAGVVLGWLVWVGWRYQE